MEDMKTCPFIAFCEIYANNEIRRLQPSFSQCSSNLEMEPIKPKFDISFAIFSGISPEIKNSPDPKCNSYQLFLNTFCSTCEAEEFGVRSRSKRKKKKVLSDAEEYNMKPAVLMVILDTHSDQTKKA